jgi:hypothetical protein
MVRIILLIVVSSVLFGSPASTGDHAKPKKGAAQTPGTTIATGGLDQSIKLWDVPKLP